MRLALALVVFLAGCVGGSPFEPDVRCWGEMDTRYIVAKLRASGLEVTEDVYLDCDLSERRWPYA